MRGEPARPSLDEGERGAEKGSGRAHTAFMGRRPGSVLCALANNVGDKNLVEERKRGGLKQMRMGEGNPERAKGPTGCQGAGQMWR